MKHIEVVAAIIVRGGKILCVKRGRGVYEYVSLKYEFPGGKVEEGEKEEDALRREIREELKLEIEINRHYMTVNHLYPDFEFIEIVDKNGERVGEGEKGEIVYTSLDWRGSVFLRYKTGDVTKGLCYEKCSCGRTLPRIDAAIERSSEYKEFKLTKIKGSFVNLNAFFSIMMGHKDIEEWQVEIKKKNNDPYEIDELVIYIAPKKNANFEKLKSSLKNKIIVETEVTPEIVKVDMEELLHRLGMETELKEKRIVDNRKNI